MTHKTFGNKKSGIEKKLLCRAIIGALSVLPLTLQAETNIFADMPFQFQKKNLTTTAFSIKPNITLYIDNSASMRERTVYYCNYDQRQKSVAPNGTITYTPWVTMPNKIDVPAATMPTYNKDRTIRYTKCKKDPDKTKINLLRPILKTIIDDYKNDMYFAFVPMNDTAVLKYNKFYDPEIASDYEFLQNEIATFGAHGSTPMHRDYVNIARNIVMNKLRYRCQKSFIVALTDGEADYWKVAASDATVDNYFYNNETQAEVKAKIKADKPSGLEYYSKTLASKNFGPYIYTSDLYTANGAAIKKLKDMHRRTVDEADQPWNAPTDDKANETLPDEKKIRFTQTAETFTIGFGLGIKGSSTAKIAVPYLERGATPPGEYDEHTNPTGRFYNANDVKEIEDAFKNIFKEIKGITTSETVQITSTTPTVGVTSTNSGDFGTTVKTDTGDWSSTLCIQKIEKIDNNNNNNNNKKECKSPIFGNRQLILNDGKNTYLYANSQLYTNSSQSLNNETFKIGNNNGKNQNEWLDGLLTWLGRSKADDEIKTSYPDFLLDYRKRAAGNTMGDIFSNNIANIGNEAGIFQKYMVTSANDGMVYVFESTEDEANPYTLKFNYMPMGIERQSNDGSDLIAHHYKDLTQADYGKDSTHPHRYLMNGTVALRQTESRNEDDPQLTFMLATMGQAGRGAFAINIGGEDLISKTPIAADNIGSGNWYNRVPLFQTPSGKDNKFGFTIGEPGIGRLRVNKDEPNSISVQNHVREAGFISNGYNYSDTLASDNTAKTSNESSLYIYDILGIDVGTDGFQRNGAAQGSLIAKIVAPGGVGGLSGVQMIDTDHDGIINYVYAGDYGGNLFRFDLNSADPGKWKATKIFSSGQPITISPMIYVPEQNMNQNNNNNNNNKLIIVFGTGSAIYQTDLNNQDQQTMYGIYDDLSKTGNDALVLKDQLLHQTYTIRGNDGYLSDDKLTDSHRGWFFNLRSNGERVVSPVDALFYTGIVYTESYKTTIEPLPKDPCVKTSRLQEITTTTGRLQFDVRNGGALSKNDPHILVNSNGEMLSSTYTDSQIGKSMINPSPAGNVVYRNNTTDTKLQEPNHETKIQRCLRKTPKLVESGPNGVTSIEIKGTVMCPVSINRLSWREIKTNYLD